MREGMQSGCDGVYAVECTGEDEVVVYGEFI